jgi:hypothetical protein
MARAIKLCKGVPPVAAAYPTGPRGVWPPTPYAARATFILDRPQVRESCKALSRWRVAAPKRLSVVVDISPSPRPCWALGLRHWAT